MAASTSNIMHKKLFLLYKMGPLLKNILYGTWHPPFHTGNFKGHFLVEKLVLDRISD